MRKWTALVLLGLAALAAAYEAVLVTFVYTVHGWPLWLLASLVVIAVLAYAYRFEKPNVLTALALVLVISTLFYPTLFLFSAICAGCAAFFLGDSRLGYRRR